MQERLAQRGGVQRGQGEADHQPADQEAEEDAADQVHILGEPHLDPGELIGHAAQQQGEHRKQTPQRQEVPAIRETRHPGVQLIGDRLEVVRGQQRGGQHDEEPQGVAPHPFAIQEAHAGQEDQQQKEGNEHERDLGI